MLMLGRKPVSPLCMPYAGIEKATNCLLEVPQKLKLELNDNVLTLKAGSVLTLTGSTYATETTATDLTYTITSSLGSGKFVIFGNSSGLATPRKINNIFSGNSSQYPTTDLTSTTVYFNTDDKLLYKPNNDLSGWNTWPSDYPFCVIDIDENNTASFAKDDNGNDIIFNNFCIIGHHYVGYPNNDLALGCNGFNTDGSYKTIHIKRNALLIYDLPKTNVSYILTNEGSLFGTGYNPLSQLPYEEVNELPTTYVAAIIYVKNENQVYRWSNGASTYQIQNNSMYYGYINLSSTGIFKSMAIQQPLTKYRWVVKLIP